MRKHINSVHQLELLLLLKRYHDRAWTANELARELYTSAPAVEQNLKHFVASRLVQEAAVKKGDMPTYQYLGDDWDADVVALVDAYRHYRVRVIDAIFSVSQEDGLKDFSDAFRLKRPEDNK